MHAARNDVAQRNKLVLEHYPMVQNIARRLHHRLPKAVELDDLVSAGTTGLIEAIDRFDETRSVPFVVYARHRVTGAIVDTLRSADWVPRSVRRKNDLLSKTRTAMQSRLGRPAYDYELAERCQVTMAKFGAMVKDSHIAPLLSLDSPTGDSNPTPLVERVTQATIDPVEQHHQQQMVQAVREALDTLPDRERTALGLYYLHELSLKEVGKVLNVSESRACQLCGQGIKRLRPRMRRYAMA